jgi:23S rRNA pseudouridine2605 synthase
MPRDSDKNNDSRGRRDRPAGGKGRSGAARGPEKKFAKRGFAGRDEGEKRAYAGKPEGARSYGKKPYAGSGKPFGGKRDGAPPRRDREEASGSRGDRPDSRKDFGRRDDRGGEKRSYTPRADARPASRFQDKKFGDKRPYTPRGEDFRKTGDRSRSDRPFARDRKGDFGHGKGGFADRKGDRGDRKGDRGDRTGDRGDRGDAKPWQKRGEGERNFDRPKFDKPRYGKARDDRAGEDRPRFSRPREEGPREDRPKFERPRRDRKGDPDSRSGWQEHPRSEARSFDRTADRPRRDNEDESKIFARRPAFGGRGAYRERTPDERRPPRPPREKKSGERIAKVVSRAGLASRRDAEEWIVQGRVTVNGRVINSPALDVTVNDVITVDGKALPPRERTRLFMYHKPRGLMTTHADPEGRPTVFDNLPEGLPRLISIGRLDFNTEGLLLLTNDGGLARALELPDTGWLRRYRVRAHGEVTQAQLDELKKGIEVDGVKYGPIDATLERDQGANVWLVFAIREGKNREVRNVLAHLGLEVNRLIRVSYGPFQLGELAEGAVEEVKTRVLREQLGEKIATLAGADFTRPLHGAAGADEAPDERTGKKPFKPAGKSGLIADRKGRRVLVQRTGSEEARARNEAEANAYGPPRRPQRGYHGKRDLKPRDE